MVRARAEVHAASVNFAARVSNHEAGAMPKMRPI